jgi:hypothetical protein
MYRYLSEFFYEEKPSRTLNKLDKSLVFLVNAQFLLQNIKLLWSPTLPIEYWESYLKLWEVMGYPSIDTLAGALKSSFILLILSISSLSIIILLFILHLFLSVYEKSTPTILIKISNLLIFMICDIYFIPFTIVLMLLFKYSTIDTNYIEEYSNQPSSESLQLGVLGQVVSLMFLVLMLSLSLIYECCKYEIRHSLTDKSVEAKSFSYLGVWVKIVYFLNCILFCTVSVYFYFYYLVWIAVVHGFIWYFYIRRLIYYSKFMNVIKVTLHFEVFFVSVFFMTGYLINNSSVIIALTVFMQPFIFMTSRLIIEYRLLKIKTLKKKIESKFHMFELSARQRLLSSENPKQLMKYMNLNYSKTQKNISFIIQAYYCSDILKNSALGSIKLSRIKSKSLSFFSGFQVYKCYKVLEAINLKTSEGFRLCFYLLMIDKILTQEKKLCKNLLGLWNKILDKKCDFDSLNKFLNNSVDLVKDIKAKYEENLAKHPLSQQMNEMYGSILIEMFGEPELGQSYLEASRSKINKKDTTKKKELFSDKDACIMIISGDEETLGKVVYMSLSMCILLGISAEDSKDYNLSDFIPKPYNQIHNQYLYGYIEHGLSQFIFNNIESCLKDKDDFLVKCILNVECVGYNLKPNFIAFVEPVNKWSAAIALVDHKGFISSHSRDFPASIGQQKYKLENFNLSEFFSKETLEVCKPDKFVFSRIYSFDQQRYVDICIYNKEIKTISKNLNFFHFVYKTPELKILQKVKGESEFIQINGPNKIFLAEEANYFEEKMDNRVNYLDEEFKAKEPEDMKFKDYKTDKKKLGNRNGDSQNLLVLEKTADVKSNSNSQPSSSNNMTLLIKKEFNQAEKSLNLLKFIGFCLVIFN